MTQEVISTTKLIDFEGVSKTYQLGNQKVQALKGIDLTINSGDFMAIAGPSGSGKSTLLNLLALIDTPTNGQITYNDIDISTLSDNQKTMYRNKEIGIVFQNYNLIPVLDALENVAFALQVQGIPNHVCLSRAEKILKEVGLGTHLHHRPANLSGGQKQRVAIARALVTNPSVVIADEPTAALDSKTGMEILDLMKELNYTKHTTFIFSTHDNRIINSVQHVVQIEDGLLINQY
ncbi:putative ABC transport system ATP-binding protein [Arcicella aurantiaca]|uniref:Putative ABC transport system ATP-binding protein n=1 Tax=Arcicella aurantiaca TaxID=591202 RepID=A0A316E0I5_9BACT|nr:ABC transporter ATP-binding protein [Arcicella aurantiaca]PWK23871.1 putative ABC transport system ATP-binding protein [Arcicella aurantiaca]